MTPDEFRALLRQPTGDLFTPTASQIVQGLCDVAAQDSYGRESRDLFLRVLEMRERVTGWEEALDALSARFGLFPYIQNLNGLSSADFLATAYHVPVDLSSRLDKLVIFHRKQHEVYWRLTLGENVVLSAPTSFGKSLLIDAAIAKRKPRSVVVVVPSLALLDESRRRLDARFRDEYKVLTHPSQTASERCIYVLTQERALDAELPTDLEFFVIDEFYKLSPRFREAGDSSGRMVLLNMVFRRLLNTGAQFYLLGPAIQEVNLASLAEFRAHFVHTQDATVASEIELRGVPSLSDLRKLIGELSGSTLIYASAPHEARKIAEALPAMKAGRHAAKLAKWLAANYSEHWPLVSALRNGVGLHHGQMPRWLAQYMVRLFNLGELGLLVCTSTLIEGVNTAAKNVVVYGGRLGRDALDFFTFNNIAGRSGRMFRHYVGRVFVYGELPPEEVPLVDFPVLSQDNAPDSLLLEVPATERTEATQIRVDEILGNGLLSEGTLRANAGVEPEVQIAVAQDLAAMKRRVPDLMWRGIPTHEALETTIQYLFEHDLCTQPRFSYPTEPYRRGLSPKAAAALIGHFSRGHQLNKIIAGEERNWSGKQHGCDNVMSFVRNFMGFGLPRGLRVFQRIQHEVWEKRGWQLCSFDFFALRVEQMFLRGHIVTLEEYGVPSVIARRLESLVPDEDVRDLDTLVAAARRWKELGLVRSSIERHILESALEWDE